MQFNNQESNHQVNRTGNELESDIKELKIISGKNYFHKNAQNKNNKSGNRFENNGFRGNYNNAKPICNGSTSVNNDYRSGNTLSNEYVGNNCESISNQNNFFTRNANRLENSKQNRFMRKYNDDPSFSNRINHQTGHVNDYIRTPFENNKFRHQRGYDPNIVRNAEQGHFHGNNNDFRAYQNMKNTTDTNRSFKNAYRGNSHRNGSGRSSTINTPTIKNIDISKLEQRELLIHELNLGHYECMICMNVIQKESAVWSCEKCYHILHLHCINKWAQSVDKKENVTEDSQFWRCPACQNENGNIVTSKLLYTCFCGKQINPSFKHGTIPHSCGDVCAHINQINSKCPHLCSLQCHPGPCPPCEASVTRQCHCGRTRITARCIADETQFGCQSVCDKIMQCGLHSCERQCHVDDGHHCEISVEQKCWCDRSTRSVVCGSEESMLERYECGVVCGRLKNCGNHSCESLCHEGECGDCEIMPDKVKNCCCGKKALKELSEERHSCLDPIASCGSICGEKYQNCEHNCQNICHRGPCEPCPGTSVRKCRCQATVQTVNCALNEVAVCRQRCKEKLLCGRHRCDRQCCDSEVHICVVDCGRMLSCKDHRCERECGHPGLCPSCPNVSFEELFCECRSTYTLPPIACGTVAPSCRHPCSRAHTCDHPVRHNCHSESQCPPCTELVNKPCPGGHSEYANIPCFRPVATCGLPCGRPLSGCTHTCPRPCHGGPCVETDTDRSCRQPCVSLRKDCGHPCNDPCHAPLNCDSVTTKCTQTIVLTCECTLRSSEILCDRLRHLATLLRAENPVTSADLIVSSKDGRTYLTCTNDCKRAARNCRLAEALNMPIPLCVLYTFYPDSIKEFGLRHKNYVIVVQNVLVRLQNGFVSTTKNSQSECLYADNNDQAHFVQRYTECFKMRWQVATDNRGRTRITIEAVRGVSRVPRPLLSEVLRDKYPHLFAEDEPDKDRPLATTGSASLTFAERLKLNRK